MNQNKLDISISSPPDREKLVADISFDNQQFAEINQETEALIIEFYPRKDSEPWEIDFEQVMAALLKAKKRLTGE